MQGRIIKIVSNQYTLLTAENKRIVSLAMGKIRLGVSPKVGDVVDYVKYDDMYCIEKVLPRKNDLIRPSIVNVDQAIVVMSCKEPDFSCTLVDRICFLLTNSNIEPIICITKMDLAIQDDPIYEYIKDYKKSGFKVLLCSNETLDVELASVLENKVTVLTGQSGVGKSTLLNSLNPTFKLNTQAISKALGRGKHTTRHVELHNVANGWVADTPGFSSLDFSKMSPYDLAISVLEFRPYLGECKFNDCKHEFEPGCAIKNAVDNKIISKIRYENYLEVLKMIKERKYK